MPIRTWLTPPDVYLASEGSLSRLNRWQRALGIYLASRAFVMILIAGVAKLLDKPVSAIVTNWDSKWYLSIVQHGYATAIPAGHGDAAQCNLGFFPLLPLCIRVVDFITGLGPIGSGLVVVYVAGAAAAVVTWHFLALRYSPVAADRGVVLVFLSPGALILSYVYTEALIILFAMSALYFLERRRWVFAGLASAILSLADPVGSAIIIPCLVASVRAVRNERDWRSLAAPLLAPLGVLGFFTYLNFHAGSFLTWFHAQRAGWQSGMYFTGVPKAVYGFIAHGFANLNPPVKTLSALVAIFLVAIVWRTRKNPATTSYIATVLGLGVFSPIIGITPRLLLRAAPLLAIAGARLRNRMFAMAVLFSALGLAFLTIVVNTYSWTP